MDYIDIYNHHGMGLEAYEKEVAPRLSKWMAKAKEQGLIRHICNSFHDNCDALKKLVDSGYTESITLQYNMLDRQLEEGMAYAHEKGVGIVVMGPVGGGRLAGSPVLEKLVPGISRVPELALRFVLANPNVDIALSGMSTKSQVVENTATVSNSSRMTEGDRAAILEHVQQLEKMADLYCTGCGYCQPCPHEVNIPVIFEKYNWGRVYGLWESAQSAYDNLSRNEWNPGKRADACVLCGKCEEKCPQHLPIREQLKEAHEKLRKKDEG